MPTEKSKKAKRKQTFTFKYIVPDQLQDCYVNGAFGGVTPRHEISMHLFSERAAIPKTISHKINDDGTLSEKVQKEFGGDAIRLVQASVIMDVNTATAIRDWLNDRIDFIKKAGEIKKTDKPTA